ncbi:hypothetical protein AKJ41_03065 [candidate division MSBL1 archaeon SCGC-AAA259O05]|uniref:Transposase IS4-like domain-containing protein n=1 Tax=candidate division MSBL1 archaeon SCGC-AAA259O05 TaxID=1698271 RepID=A0A133V3I6_9EURY|nr:hypothetical protein AKJ41_03065 [candidate division MSBL1 archaeon SCGC-AAA259O05]
MDGKSRSIAELCNGTIKTFASFFNPAPNSVYGSFDLARTLIKLGKDKSSAERLSKPSPDVILRRLHQIDMGEAVQGIKALNEELLESLILCENPMIAIDFKTVAYYGEENPMLVGDSRLNGTNLGMRFAVLSIIEKGKTFTLWVRQVSPLESKVSIVEELLNYAQKLVDPGIILLDRGFYSVKVIKMLKSKNQSFVIAGKKTSPVKKLCEEFKHGNKDISEGIDYTVQSSDDKAEVKLTLVEKETKNGVEIHPFVSDHSLEPEEVSNAYPWRWRIETNIREFDKFAPFTTSQSMQLRHLYFFLAMLLYNLWIATRNGRELPRAHQFKEHLKFLLTVFTVLGEKPRPPPETASA